MKKVAFTLLLFLACCRLTAQCPTGDIIFTTQGQIKSFPMNYPGCTHIPGSISIGEQYSWNIINHLDSLSQISFIGGNLNIFNTNLMSLKGLHNLDSIGGNLYVEDNSCLTNLSGLNNLTSIGGYLNMTANTGLTSLSGLDNLTSIGGELFLWANYYLTSLSGLGNLISIGGNMELNTNVLKSVSSLGNLISIGGDLYVNEPCLTSLSGLGNLISIGGDLYLMNTKTLTSLSGLENLTSLGGGLYVTYNHSLTSLSGLDNVDFAATTEMEIFQNPKLALCNVQSVCELFESGGGFPFIFDNASGCDNIYEVKAACLIPTNEAFSVEPPLQIFPNPAGGFLQIQISDPETWDVSLLDLQGRQVWRQQVSGSRTIELKNWPAGLYTIRAVSGASVFSGKIVKQ